MIIFIHEDSERIWFQFCCNCFNIRVTPICVVNGEKHGVRFALQQALYSASFLPRQTIGYCGNYMTDRTVLLVF
jgi:hypothetical protein